MKSLNPAKMILPAILAVGLTLYSFSLFTGSAFMRKGAQPAIQAEKSLSSLSSHYPASIQQWKDHIEATAHQNGLDPNLIAAVMLQESGGSAEVVSWSGAVGLMQVMPRDGIAASFMCGSQPCFASRPSTDELLEPTFNIQYGTRMLAGLIQKKGSVREALFSYGPYDVGYRYADIVLDIYENYQ
jgi:soluble lytic murein transglycosylase-like protein